VTTSQKYKKNKEGEKRDKKGREREKINTIIIKKKMYARWRSPNKGLGVIARLTRRKGAWETSKGTLLFKFTRFHFLGSFCFDYFNYYPRP
jgi:hypothetical protein